MNIEITNLPEIVTPAWVLGSSPLAPYTWRKADCVHGFYKYMYEFTRNRNACTGPCKTALWHPTYGARHNFSKVRAIATVYSKYTRALTFENVPQADCVALVRANPRPLEPGQKEPMV